MRLPAQKRLCALKKALWGRKPCSFARKPLSSLPPEGDGLFNLDGPINLAYYKLVKKGEESIALAPSSEGFAGIKGKAGDGRSEKRSRPRRLPLLRPGFQEDGESAASILRTAAGMETVSSSRIWGFLGTSTGSREPAMPAVRPAFSAA